MPRKKRIEIEEEFEKPSVNFTIKSPTFRSENQKEFFLASQNDLCQVLICNGPAGSAKTFLAIYSSLMLIKKQPRFEKLIYVRSPVESADQRMGYLPGDLGEKFFAYTTPLEEKLSDFLDEVNYKKLKDKAIVESTPINFLRGVSWKNSCIILDEAQNLTFRELKTFLTRVGEDCKVFLLGDHSQSDIGNKSGFHNIMTIFNNYEAEQNGLFTVEFDQDDIERSKLCAYIVGALNNFENHESR
jgi:phosphate starvation-inducible PhoH-like protein